jgi:hypothetical protein
VETGVSSIKDNFRAGGVPLITLFSHDWYRVDDRKFAIVFRRRDFALLGLGTLGPSQREVIDLCFACCSLRATARQKYTVLIDETSMFSVNPSFVRYTMKQLAIYSQWI